MNARLPKIAPALIPALAAMFSAGVRPKVPIPPLVRPVLAARLFVILANVILAVSRAIACIPTPWSCYGHTGMQVPIHP